MTACNVLDVECLWLAPPNATAYCTARTCADLNSTFCPDQGCSFAGSDATGDFVCYSSGTGACRFGNFGALLSIASQSRSVAFT